MFRNLRSISQVCLKGLKNSGPIVPTQRNLYAPAALGVDTYTFVREKVRSQLAINEQKFREKMNEFVQDQSENMVFTEDLKNMVHLVESTPEDVDLVIRMVKKYHTQNKEVRFGNFIFGPIVMRMFYHLNDVNNALACFKSPELDGFFDQLISYQILLDMLYENGQYQEVLNIFDEIRQLPTQGGRFPKHTVVLALASCYKLNTKESFEYCSKLWKELNEVGHHTMRKGATFAAGTALRQNAPQIALEILSTIKDQHYVSVRNLSVIAYAESGRPDNALPILRSVLEIDEPVSRKRTFIRLALDKVRESIEKNAEKELLQDFNKIESVLTNNNQVSDNSIDDILCSEIKSTSFTTQKRNKSFIAASFSNDRNWKNNRNDKYKSRQGLSELY